jgi:hypothetical protein
MDGIAMSNNATIISYNFPLSIARGVSTSVSVTVQNTGTTAWTIGSGYGLGDPNNDNAWGLSRVYMPTTVAPGSTYTFAFNIITNSSAATQKIRWGMVLEGVEWFGPLTPDGVYIAIANGTNNATLVSYSFPISVNRGVFYPVSVTVQNTGTTTWTASSGHLLGDTYSENKWGMSRVYIPQGISVAPGATHTFNFTIITRTSNPSLYIQWGMVLEGVEWFGAQTPSGIYISVTGSDTENYDWGLWVDTSAERNWWTTAVGKKFSHVTSSYSVIDDDWTSQRLEMSISNFIDYAYSNNAEPVFMMSTWGYTMNDIINGVADSRLVAMAQRMAADGRTIHLRLWWEMNNYDDMYYWNGSAWEIRNWGNNPNGAYAPWFMGLQNNPSGPAGGHSQSVYSSASTFTAAWQHIVNLFRSNGATNVKWWWTISSYVESSTPAGAPFTKTQLYPGDSYVDIIGLEFYHGVLDNPPIDEFVAVYNELVIISASKPIVVAEAGVFTTNPYKTSWLANVLNPSVLQAYYPRITGFFYWENTNSPILSLRDTITNQNTAIAAYQSSRYKNGTGSPVSVGWGGSWGKM